MNIFADNAPKYWAAGLPVIPLMAGEKRPAINGWQRYADVFPEQEDRDLWLDMYAPNNMGMPLGPSAGFVAIDIDVLEPEVQQIIERFLPKTPWIRVGKKGSVRLFRYNGHRTARIRKADGSMIVEILSKGSQIAMPPSIHPDTGMPYTANCELVDVLDKIPELAKDIEDKLRGALEAAGIKLSSRGSASVTKWVPAGARDNAMVAHAGLLSRGILKGERTLLEGLDEIAEWCRSFVEKVSGDEIDPDKARQKLVEFLVRDVKGGRPLPEGWDRGLSLDDKEKMGLDFADENELWGYDRIKDYLHGEFTAYSIGSSERIGAIEYALERMGQNKDMSPLHEESLLRYMCEASGKQVSLATLKSRLKNLRYGGIEGTDQTQIAEAVIKELEKTGEIRGYGVSLWQWVGSHWAEMPKDDVLRVIAREFGHLPAAKKASDHKGVYEIAVNSVRVKKLGENEQKGMNFANGFLTADLELLDHDPEQGMTYCLPYRYLPEMAGHMPLFTQFLHDAWGHDPDFEDKVQTLREAIASTMFQMATDFQRAFCLIGVAHSGKTTLMQIVSGLMPPEAKCSIPPTKWGERFSTVGMMGKLLNQCGELTESGFITGDMFKLIVEGTPIEVERKGIQGFEITPMCAHWFATNHMPRSKDSSEGFTRRWLPLEFNRAMPVEKKIERYYEYILSEEVEAIAAWAAEGILSLKRNHEYTLPSSSMALLDDMANANNSVRMFLKTCNRVKREESLVVREYELYMEYRSFCAGTLGVQASQMKTFSSRMKELQTEFQFRRVIKAEHEVDVVEYHGVGVNKKAKM